MRDGFAIRFYRFILVGLLTINVTYLILSNPNPRHLIAHALALTVGVGALWLDKRNSVKA